MYIILRIFIRYGKDGVSGKGYDCAMIPGGITATNKAMNIEEFCGGKLDKQITSMYQMNVFL